MKALKCDGMEIHPLRRWLMEHNEGVGAFAARIGVAQSSVSQWLRRNRMPRGIHMAEILKATGGAVTPGDLVRHGPQQHRDSQQMEDDNGQEA